MSHEHAMMHGNAIENAIAEQVNRAIFGSETDVIDPNSPEAKSRADFYSNVVAQSGEKFVASPEGKAAIDGALKKVTVSVALPALLIGLAVGWYLGSRRKS